MHDSSWSARILKVGDMVAVRPRTGFRNVLASSVAKISPSGQITLRNGFRFTSYGEEISGGRSCYLEEYTQEVAREVERAVLLYRVKTLSEEYNKFSNEDLKKLILFLESNQRKTNAKS